MTCTLTINGSSHHFGHYYRLFSPNCPLVVAVQCTSRRHTHASRRERARVLSHAHATHLSPVRMYALIYDGTPATTTTRGNSVPGAPSALREGPASRRRPSSSPLLPFRGLRDPPSRSVSGNVLSSAPRRVIEFRTALNRLLEKKERNLRRRKNAEMSDTIENWGRLHNFFLLKRESGKAVIKK